MTVMKVIKNTNNDVINIGNWDYQIENYIDDKGNSKEIIKNPIPEYAIESTADIIVGEDGGLYVNS